MERSMINLIAKTVTIEENTKMIIMNEGVIQEDGLSTTLFTIARNELFSATDIDKTTAQSLKQMIAYSDDLVSRTKSKKEMEKALLKIMKETRSKGT